MLIDACATAREGFAPAKGGCQEQLAAKSGCQEQLAAKSFAHAKGFAGSDSQGVRVAAKRSADC